MATQMQTGTNALQALREDHRKVKELFEKFEQTEDEGSRQSLVETAIKELKIHAKLEEELLYPAAEKNVDDEDLVPEALEEHHVAKLLIKELEGMGPDDEHYAAKFTVLAENVKHHIEEEESELFPKLEDSDLDLEEVGRKMMERKQELLEEMEGTSGRSKSRARSGRVRPHSAKGRGQRNGKKSR